MTAKSTTIITELFFFILLITAYTMSSGIQEPLAMTLLKTHSYAAHTHYEVTNAYSEMGLAYTSKIAVPAGSAVILHEENCQAVPNKYRGTAVMLPDTKEQTYQKAKVIGKYDKDGFGSYYVRGPSWIFLRSTPDGAEVIDYGSNSGVADYMKNNIDHQIPFAQQQTIGLGNTFKEALKEVIH
jgi:hypothetical protein